MYMQMVSKWMDGQIDGLIVNIRDKYGHKWATKELNGWIDIHTYTKMDE